MHALWSIHPGADEVALAVAGAHTAIWGKLEFHCGCIKHKDPNRIGISRRPVSGLISTPS